VTKEDWKAAGTLALITCVVALADAMTFHGETGRLGTAGLAVEACYIVLPAVGAAWAISTQRVTARETAGVVAIVMVAMLATDLIPTAGPPRMSEQLMLGESLSAELAPAPPRWSAGGAASAMVDCLATPECLSGSDGALDAGSDRFREVLAFYKPAYLLAPFIVLSFARWVHTWATVSLAFLTASARHVVGGLTTWAIPAGAVYVTLAFAGQGLTAALVRGHSPIAILEAYLPLFGVAGLAWLSTPDAQVGSHR